jgi:phosphatidylserine/phosphatidylglycerophosphate/cardiolipin synthase-like enzyme
MSPLIVKQSLAAVAAAAPTLRLLELVPRNCTLDGSYRKMTSIGSVSVGGAFIAYASPDSTYAVTRRLFDAARTEILIAIYDFSADYVKDLLLTAMQRGVKVGLKLDIDSDDEEKLFDELARFGCKAVPAPSCASENIHVFPSSHEKVIVIDGEWVLVQSGNYSSNSIPFNQTDGGDAATFVKGNRDMGVAVHSRPLAEFFAKRIRADMKLELDATGPRVAGAAARRPEPALVEAVPKLLPANRFPSKEFSSRTVAVTPILSPDNYMSEVPAFIASATKSILIEQQYIRSTQPEIAKLLAAIASARKAHPKLDVRIILGKLFSPSEVPKEKANLANLKKTYGLKLAKNIRYIDTRRFVHCHNKLVIVDGTRVLVSSQNWSDAAVARNREAGLLFRYPEIAGYFAKIFESDWKTASKKIPGFKKKQTVTPEAVARGNFVEVRAADYQEV